MEASRAFAEPRPAGSKEPGRRPTRVPPSPPRRGTKIEAIYGKHDHTRGTVGIEAYADAAVGHGATCMGAASGPSSARSAAISLRISATMARTASSSCDVRSVLRAALGSSDMVFDVGRRCVVSTARNATRAAWWRRRGLS